MKRITPPLRSFMILSRKPLLIPKAAILSLNHTFTHKKQSMGLKMRPCHFPLEKKGWGDRTWTDNGVVQATAL